MYRYDIGLLVGIPKGVLDTIREDYNNSGARLREMCIRLVQSGEGETVILDKVRRALTSKAVKRLDVARKISSNGTDEQQTRESEHLIQGENCPPKINSHAIVLLLQMCQNASGERALP